MTTRPLRLDRRTFLIATGAGVVAVACGGDGSGDTQSGASGAAATAPAGTSIVQRWIPTANAVGAVRLPFSLADANGLLLGGPDELEVRIVDYDTGDVVVEPFRVPKESLGPDLPPFWVATAQLDQPGIYRLQVLGGDPEGASVQVLPADEVIVPQPGEALPPFDTPTVEDPRGVEPICSRLEGPCPFHEVTLTEALGAATPVVYLIGTPAHCQTGTCGPVLEDLIAIGEQVGDAAVIVHADVYTDDTATEVAPAVRAYQMEYEPALWVAGADGIIVARFDSVWARREVEAALTAAGA